MVTEQARCHDCGCAEGEIHMFGCDMERCPFCGRQLLSCRCIYEQLHLVDKTRYKAATSYLPPDVYYKGVTDQQEAKWLRILNRKGRIPYIRWPVRCARCGTSRFQFFMVTDDCWRHYIQPDMQDCVVCRPCFTAIVSLIDGISRSEARAKIAVSERQREAGWEALFADRRGK